MTKRAENSGSGDFSLLYSNSSGLMVRAFFPSCEPFPYVPCFAFPSLRLKRRLSWLIEQTGFAVASVEEAVVCNRAARVS